VLLGVTAAQPSVIASEGALLLGVGAPAWTAPLPGLDPTWSVPPEAAGLHVRAAGRDLATVGERGGALGWVDRFVVTTQPRPSGQPPSVEQIVGWLAAGLPLDAPDRFPASPREGWVPLLGSGDATAERDGLAVPLSVAPWAPHEAALVLLR